MSTIHLKIKIRSLAAEARIIRAEERKYPGLPHDWWDNENYRTSLKYAVSEHRRKHGCVIPDAFETRLSLHGHRVGVVRPEARHALLAYAFLRGRKYRDVERSCYTNPDANHVAEIAYRFGSGLYANKDAYFKAIRDWFSVVEAEQPRSAA